MQKEKQDLEDELAKAADPTDQKPKDGEKRKMKKFKVTEEELAENAQQSMHLLNLKALKNVMVLLLLKAGL